MMTYIYRYPCLYVSFHRVCNIKVLNNERSCFSHSVKILKDITYVYEVSFFNNFIQICLINKGLTIT